MKTAKQSIDLEYKGTKKRLNLRTALISLCMFAFVGTSAQTGTVTVKLQNASIKELFSAIEKQTSYRFSYRDAEIKGKGNVTISATNRELKQLLEGELSKLGLKYAVSGNKIIVTPVAAAASAQPKKVTGKVVDANGEPVIGATIKEQGTANGTITDFDGNFALDVADNAMLEVSYIGYKSQKLKAVAGKTLSVTLKEDAEVLDEVVVVGYGTQKKSTLTGAVSMMDMDDTEMNTAVSVSHVLAGKAAGFRVNQVSAQPGGAANFRIRGEASTGAGNEPLFVIDGFPVSSSWTVSSGTSEYYGTGSTDNVLESLNPDDIESISVLKDAASTSIYGARAGHGVVLITTKRGKNQKPRITYSGVGSFQVARANYKMLDTRAYMDMYNKQQYEEWLKTNGLGIYEGYVDRVENPIPFTPTFTNDQIMRAEGTNWLDEVTRPGYMHQHNLSVNGGTEKTRYMVSVNYMNQEGIVKRNGTSRLSARLNLDQEVNKYLSIGLTASYAQNKYDNVPLGDQGYERSGVLAGAVLFNPTLPVYNEDGEYTLDPMRSTTPNPVSLLEIQDKTVKDRIMGNAFVIVKPLSGLEVKLSLGADRSMQKRSSYFPKTTLQGQIKNGDANISQQNNTTYLMELTAQYSKNWRSHSFKVLSGYSFQKFDSDGVRAGNSDFLIDGFGYNCLGAGNYAKPTVGSWASINSIASLFARVNYSFAGKYLLEGTVRADAASNFAPENRWGYFPSISAGWLISEEKFMESAKSWLSMLKLRTSFGQTGNSNVGYRIKDYFAPGYNAIIGDAELKGVYASQLGNKDITWETTTEFNLGVDMGFFNNRVRLTTEYFKRQITDLLVGAKPLPFYNEVNTIAGNVGATESQGFELTLNTINIVAKDFEWDTTLTLSHYADRWKERDPNWRPEPYQKENDPIRAWWTYEALGIMQPGEQAPDAQKDLLPGQMKLKDQNEDGVLDNEDMVYMGTGDPKIIYGFNNSLKYKNFDLSVYFYGEAGRKGGASYYESWTRMDNGTNVSSYSLDAYCNANTTSSVPSFLRSTYGLGDYYVKSIYFIRCGNITLGYRVPVPSKFIKNMRVYIDVNNPFVITNWTGLDPETDTGSYPYPNVTSYNFGVSISF